MDFDWDQVDFEYGGPISAGWRGHIAGYVRSGEGPKDTGFTANSGYQVKANITRELDNGYIRVNFKRLDDRLCCSLAGPAVLSGTNGNPKISKLPGYDFMNDAIQSPYLASDLYIDGAGRPAVADTRDGTRPMVTALGSEVHLDVLEGWQVTDKFRYSRTSSEFLAPFVGGRTACAGSREPDRRYHESGNAGQCHAAVLQRSARRGGGRRSRHAERQWATGRYRLLQLHGAQLRQRHE